MNLVLGVTEYIPKLLNSNKGSILTKLNTVNTTYLELTEDSTTFQSQ